MNTPNTINQNENTSTLTTLVLGVPTFDAVGLQVVQRLVLDGRKPVHVIVPSKELFLNQLVEQASNDGIMGWTRETIEKNHHLLRITEEPSFLTDHYDHHDDTTPASTKDATILKAHINSVETVIVVPSINPSTFFSGCNSTSTTSAGRSGLLSCCGPPSRMVLTETVQTLVRIMAATRGPPTRKLILVSTAMAVTLPTDTDRIQSTSRMEKWRWNLASSRLVANYSDHQHAGAYLQSLVGTGNMQWCVLRAGVIRDDKNHKNKAGKQTSTVPATGYRLYDQLPVLQRWTQTCKNACQVHRANVATCLMDLITRDEMWNRYKLRMPVLLNHDDSQQPKEESPNV